MATFEDALNAADQLRNGKELSNSLSTIIQVLRGASFHLPERFKEFHQSISERIGQPLPDWLVEHQDQLLPHARYVVATWLSASAISDGDYDLAMAYWAPVLVTERPPESEDLVGISAKVAEQYDSEQVHRLAASDLCRFALAATPSAGRKKLDVLDICCGTGLHADYLKWSHARLVGIDLELEGLVKAGRSTRYTELAQGDAMIESGKITGEFDLVLLGNATYFFDDLEWLFEQSARLLRPGGALVFGGFPCPDSADRLITPSGTFRYCHSDRYLRQLAERHGLTVKKKSWQVIYAHMPNWFWCFTKNAA